MPADGVGGIARRATSGSAVDAGQGRLRGELRRLAGGSTRGVLERRVRGPSRSRNRVAVRPRDSPDDPGLSDAECTAAGRGSRRSNPQADLTAPELIRAAGPVRRRRHCRSDRPRRTPPAMALAPSRRGPVRRLETRQSPVCERPPGRLVPSLGVGELRGGRAGRGGRAVRGGRGGRGRRGGEAARWRAARRPVDRRRRVAVGGVVVWAVSRGGGARARCGAVRGGGGVAVGRCGGAAVRRWPVRSAGCARVPGLWRRGGVPGWGSRDLCCEHPGRASSSGSTWDRLRLGFAVRRWRPGVARAAGATALLCGGR